MTLARLIAAIAIVLGLAGLGASLWAGLPAWQTYYEYGIVQGKKVRPDQSFLYIVAVLQSFLVLAVGMVLWIVARRPEKP